VPEQFRSSELVLPLYGFVLLVVLAAVIIYIETIIVAPKIAPLLDEGALSDAQSTAISYTKDLGELMINWSVALIGAIALSTRNTLKSRGLIKVLSALLLGLAFLCCIISIWLGMLVLDLTINSLALEQDPLNNASLYLCRRWQYLSFVGALVLFVLSWIISAAYPLQQEKDHAL
jgi:hypothetical protein